MSRIIKKPEERKNDILNAAEKLFRKNGYQNTVVSDIVKEANIAQGTFYIYFKSKEDVFVAVLDTISDKLLNQILKVKQRDDLNAIEKMNLTTEVEINYNENQDDLVSQMHLPQNVGIHQRYIVGVINKLAPVYASIIEQGVLEGTFNTFDSMNTAEYMSTAIRFMVDPAIFNRKIDDYPKLVKTIMQISERILGIPENSLKIPDVSELVKGSEM